MMFFIFLAIKFTVNFMTKLKLITSKLQNIAMIL